MTERIIPAVLAVGIGAAIVLAVLVPIVALSYRRRGGFGTRDLLVVAAIPVYGLALLSYTLLPLPGVDDVASFCAGRSLEDVLQPRPFQFVADILRLSARQEVTGPRAWVANSAVQQVVLNVALFAPLGWLLRGPFRRSLGTVVAAGLGVSLLIEVTQLTGNWFLFPCAYRLADVDDLIANTAGALLGGLLAALVRPRRDGAVVDPDRPAPVTVSRRLLGVLCDVLAVWSAGILLGAVLLGVAAAGGMSPLPEWFDGANQTLGFWVPLLAFLAIPMIGDGGTVGQRAVRLRPATPDGGVPPRGRRLLRALLGTGALLLLSGPSGALGLLGTLWGLVSLVALVRTRAHTGLAGRITGLTMVDAREHDREPVRVP
ncbi:VanZ family protein [Pseudonocardia sp. HH130630-07]|uniref:VanZ family protein n=1 Tax=Pseudonocardia sp. HH130630-07 TaxID=1690815 RepID=UPI000814B8A0|nr:VanZ family protein [Pseudonocardia sp. HH130630-07]ANY09212.1 hypothetical protein AFB00_26540 [Pseudonocardia sp. HH130630-07]